MYQNLLNAAKIVLKGKEIHSDTVWPLETEKSQINNLTFHPQNTRKRINKTLFYKKAEKINIREEINEIDTKKKMEKIWFSKNWFFEKIKLTNH